MEAARELVERVARGEHTYGVNTGFGRFVSRTIPDDQVEELQLRLLRSHACGVGDPYPDEVVRAAMLLRANTLAKGYSGARVELVELLVECLNRGVLPRVPSRGSVGASGDLAPLAHLALPLVGEGEAWVNGELLGGGGRARGGRPRAAAARREGGALADQRDAVHGRDGGARARPGAAARAHRGSRVRALARGAAGLAHELPSRDPRGAPAARAARLGSEPDQPARGLGDHRVAPLVRPRPGRLLAPLRAAGARRQPRPDRPRRGDGLGRAECRDGQPARPRRRGSRRLERQLPRPAARVRARPARARGRGARVDLGATDRAARQSVAVGGAATVPDRRGRAQLGVHDPAVRGRVARLREQGAVPSGERRLDSDERGPGGPRLDGQHRRPARAAGARERGARARDRAARRGAGDRVPGAARARAGRPGDTRRACASCRSGCATTARSPATSSRWLRRSETARSSTPRRRGSERCGE